MVMTWFDLSLSVTVAALLVMVPGLIVVSVLGLRGIRLWGLAAPASVTIVSTAALAAPLVGVPWSVLPVIATTVLFAVVALVLRVAVSRFSGRPLVPARPMGAVGSVAFVGALAVAGLAIAVQVIVMLGEPDNISQTFDNVFHLNAIRYAAEHANASPLFIASMTSGDGSAGFYPSGWHAFGSLVLLTTSSSVPVASNAIMIVFAALVWPASVILLVRELGISSRAGLLAAGASAAAFPAFPMLMLEYGVLYPYMMGVSLVPAVVAVVLRLASSDGQGGRAGWAIVSISLLPGVAVAHPGALVAVLVFSTGLLAITFVRTTRRAHSTRRRAILVSVAVVYLAVFAAAWYALRPEDAARSWTPQETVAQAVGEVVAVAPWYAPVNLVMAVLVVTGAFVAIRHRRTSDVVMLVVFGVAAFLYVVVSGLPYWEIRDLLVGAWYNNAPRLAALLPIAWVPLAARGAELLWRRLRVWQAQRRSGVLASAWSAVAAAVVVMVVIPQGGVMRQAVASAAPVYRFSDDAPLVSADELALIEKVPQIVPDDAVIVGSPWTGVALTYALADRRVLMPHTLTTTTSDADLINEGLNDATEGSAVCEAVRDLNAQYVLDFGRKEVNDGTHVYPGLRYLASSDAVELVESVGSARLYRIVACGS